MLSDGSTLWITRSLTRGPDAWLRRGKGGTVRTTIAASRPDIGKIQFEWKGYEVPVSFDIVGRVPWVVLPIAGLDSCEKYGNPPESVAAFRWTNGRWTPQPFAATPRSLKYNILPAIPIAGSGRVSHADKQGAYTRTGYGMELTRGFIRQHAKWEHACGRLNAPQDAAQARSLKDYAERDRIVVTGEIVEVKDDLVALDFAADQALMGASYPMELRNIVGCKGKVSRMETVAITERERGGITSRASAYRILLSDEVPPKGAIYLPYPTDRSHVARVTCSEERVYVLVRERVNVLSVIAYDLDGNWAGAWRVQVAGLELPDNYWAPVVAFEDAGDRFKLTIGHYQPNTGTTGATLGKRFLIEAGRP